MTLAGFGAGFFVHGFFSGDDTYRQLQKMETSFMTIVRQYVDDLSPADVAEDAIGGMLETLDPHSIYIPAEEMQDVQEGYQGSFGGIGIWFEIVNDTARITATITDGPSEAVGLMAGDRIVRVDDTTAVGLNNLGIQGLLKGEIGTRVHVEVLRLGEEQARSFDITRGKIPLYSVDASFKLDDETGYIKVSRFSAETYNEFVEHTTRLRAEGMTRLIIDLRNNPGGVMESAIRMVDEILPGTDVIVETKGRDGVLLGREQARAAGGLEQMSVIVMINENAASASEIVAGALQDHDRALIVGRRSFGKGLVQYPFPLPDGSVLQMTVARYYTPSGRLIQTPYEYGDTEGYFESKFSSLESATFDVTQYVSEIPDSLRFTTRHNRTVYGGGGILPDIITPPDTAAALMSAIYRKNLTLRFMREHFSAHERELRETWGDRPEAFVSSYAIDQALEESFWAYADEQGIRFSSEAPGTVESTVDDSVAVGVRTFRPQQKTARQPLVRTLLKARLAQNLYGSRLWYEIMAPADEELVAAQTHWPEADRLARLRH